MKGAKAVLINITGGMDMTLFEVDEAANRIRSEVDPDATIIFGSAFDEKLEGVMRVSVVATGLRLWSKPAHCSSSTSQISCSHPSHSRKCRLLPVACRLPSRLHQVMAEEAPAEHSVTDREPANEAETAEAAEMPTMEAVKWKQKNSWISKQR